MKDELAANGFPSNKTRIIGYINDLKEFRSKMNRNLDQNHIKAIWGEIDVDNFPESEKRTDCSESKIVIAKSNLRHILLFNWVKYVGISGSVAAGFAREEDDIDLFVVVKNHRLWIYRLLIWIRNIDSGVIRRLGIKTGNSSVETKDKFCMNFIVEERGLEFDKQDLFTLHELFYLIPIYNPGYFPKIVNANKWLAKNFSIRKYADEKVKNSIFSLIFLPFNFLFFLIQLCSMLYHSFNPKKAINGFIQGKAVFYPEDTRQRVSVKRD